MKNLLYNTAIYGVANFGSKVLSFALLPVYSFYLTKEEFGYFDLILTTVALLVPLVTLQISDSLFRWLMTVKEDQAGEKQSIISNCFGVLLIMEICVVLISLVVYFASPMQHYLLIVILLLISSVYPVVQQAVRGLRRRKLYASSGIVYTATMVTATLALLVVFDMTITAVVVSAILANLVATIYMLYCCNIIALIKIDSIDWKMTKTLLQYSAPLIPNAISWWLVNSANKYIVLFSIGLGANGLFAMSSRFPALLAMINAIFILAWQESAILNFNDKDRAVFFSKTFLLLGWIQITAACIFTLSSEYIVRQFIAHEYYESWRYMPFLFFGVVFSTLAGFFGSMYLSAKETRAALTTTIVGGAINLVTCAALVSSYGLLAVSFATFLGFFTIFGVRLYHTRRYMRLTLPNKDILYLSSATVMSLVVGYGSNDKFKIVLVLVLLVAFLVKTRPMWAVVVRSIRKRIYGIS